MAVLNEPGHSDDFVRPPLSYPGNKAELAESIIECFPEHETYVEPFGGTASVLFNKSESRNEVINDINTSLTTFMRVLRDDVEPLIEYIRQTPYSEAEYDRIKAKWKRDYRPADDVKHAAWLFFLRRGSFGSDLGGFRAEATGRKNSARQFRNATERLRELSGRLQEVVIRNTDWRDVIEKYASPDTFFFLDPPYRGLEGYYDHFFQYDMFQDYWIHHFDGSLNSVVEEAHDWVPPAFLEQPAFKEADEDFQYGSPRSPFDVLICSDGPLDGLMPYTWTLKLPGHTHEINNLSGSKEVAETLTMNYNPNAPDFQPFLGTDQQSLQNF